jgi:hypothetical protein
LVLVILFLLNNSQSFPEGKNVLDWFAFLLGKESKSLHKSGFGSVAYLDEKLCVFISKNTVLLAVKDLTEQHLVFGRS